jgi:hypothetical protein
MGSDQLWFFPLRRGSKLPAAKGWQEQATRDPAQVAKWRAQGKRLGISTSRFGDGEAVVAVDVDMKKGKNGEAEILRLDIEGYELPPTLEQKTLTGGRHLIYRVPAALKQGADVLGPGLDIRSRGGYVVEYGLDDTPVAPCPQWLVDRLGLAPDTEPQAHVVLDGIDTDRALRRATEWLEAAPASVEGEAGDQTAFRVAAKLKDFGLDQVTALDLMLGDWNESNDPPWEAEDLAVKVANAYAYGKEPQGAAAPEAAFAPVAKPARTDDGDEPDEPGHPFDVLNREFAFVKKGAFVLQETTDEEGRFVTEHLNMAEFHGWHANQPFRAGNARPRPISECWLEWADRRQYEAVVFAPQQDLGPRWYNMWRGYTVEPAATGDHPAVAAFCEHALKNICGGNQEHYAWLMGYFAHMVQRPFEKPLVALVFKGAKGTGKNALVERVGALLGNHFMVADDDRYLTGNFNSHLEANLFLALDEAAWAGDKRAEGRLKGLITGQHHNIERKGKEVYRVRNLTRVAIIGNEDWLVPATQDERRFAVFNVGDGRKQDRAFFERMRLGMEAGGYAHLLRFLQDFPISDVNAAPVTAGLAEQKLASLGPQESWWHDCLATGSIAGGDWAGQWPEKVPTNRLRDAFSRWAKQQNIKSRLPKEDAFGKCLAAMTPSFARVRTRPKDPTDTTWSYATPGLDALRAEWDKFIGCEIDWTES